MASPRTRRVLKDLKVKDENNNCFECKSHNPQWVSVNHGIWICLECSGKHRSLGVHLSFVRSVSMDKWKELELEKMKAGGNYNARLFFESQDDYHDGMSLQEKYSSKCAALYRDKILNLAQGKSWSIETSSARDYVSSSIYKSSSTTNGNTNYSYGMNNSSYSDNSIASSGYQNDSYQANFGMSKEEVDKRKEDYFSQILNENQNRPDDKRPCEGGKYVGFGNTPQTIDNGDDYYNNTWSTLSSGWSSIASGASRFASITTEKASKIVVHTAQKTKQLSHSVNEKVKEGTILENVTSGITQLSTKVKEGVNYQDVSTTVVDLASKVQTASMKGWSGIASMWGDRAAYAIPNGSDMSPTEGSSLLGQQKPKSSFDMNEGYQRPLLDTSPDKESDSSWSEWNDFSSNRANKHPSSLKEPFEKDNFDSWGEWDASKTESSKTENGKTENDKTENGKNDWNNDWDTKSDEFNKKKLPKLKSNKKKESSKSKNERSAKNLIDFDDAESDYLTDTKEVGGWDNEVWAADEDNETWQSLE